MRQQAVQRVAQPVDLDPDLKRDAVYEQVLLDIICAELRPGERVDEIALAERYRAGRAGIRDTLYRLALEGLVERRPRLGTVVANPSVIELQQVFQLRVQIEGQCAALAARNARKDEIEAINRAFGMPIARSRRPTGARSCASIGPSTTPWPRPRTMSGSSGRSLTLHNSALRFWHYALPRRPVDAVKGEIAGHLEVAAAIAARDPAGGAGGDAHRPRRVSRHGAGTVLGRVGAAGVNALAGIAAQATAPAVVVERVSKSFVDPAGMPLAVLEDISFALNDREIVALLGTSGCGKSTLLNIMAGLQEADAGKVIVVGCGSRVTAHRSLGYVFQDDRLLPWRTALRNVTFSLEAGSTRRAERDARARKVLDLMDLTAFAGAYPHQLSGGMRSRVALARSLVLDPRIADGRAVRAARRPDPRADAHRGAAHQGAARHVDHLRHPRRRRSGGAGRSRACLCAAPRPHQGWRSTSSRRGRAIRPACRRRVTFAS